MLHSFHTPWRIRFHGSKGTQPIVNPIRARNPIFIRSQNILLRNRPRSKELAPSLFALTAQSNITNSKNPLSMIEYASSLGYNVLMDAAALAPTSGFSLSEYPVDAMAVSFYKMFGFPTGVGALVVKRRFLEQLKRPWFAGGTVDVVQVPGNIVTRAHELHEQFEVSLSCFSGIPCLLTRFLALAGWHHQLPHIASCDGWITIPFCIFTLSPSATLLPPPLPGIITFTITP